MGSFVDIIFLTVLVVFLITKLYTVFGSHGKDKSVRIVIKSLDKDAEKNLAENISRLLRDKKDGESAKDGMVADVLSEKDEITSKISGFNKDNFLRGACRVFEIVLQAFSSGNIDNIKSLVGKKIWDALNQAISFRKENDLTAEVDFIGFEKSEIKDIKLLKNSVKIVVEFVSEQVNILKNKKGEVVEGDENFVQKITDIWTFERSLNDKNNKWVLVSTKKSA